MLAGNCQSMPYQSEVIFASYRIHKGVVRMRTHRLASNFGATEMCSTFILGGTKPLAGCRHSFACIEMRASGVIAHIAYLASLGSGTICAVVPVALALAACRFTICVVWAAPLKANESVRCLTGRAGNFSKKHHTSSNELNQTYAAKPHAIPFR